MVFHGTFAEVGARSSVARMERRPAQAGAPNNPPDRHQFYGLRHSASIARSPGIERSPWKKRAQCTYHDQPLGAVPVDFTMRAATADHMRAIG